MAHTESSIIHKLFSLPEDQDEIKFQDLAAAMKYNQSDDKSARSQDLLELYRGLNPSASNSSHPTVSDAVDSLSNQIATYKTVLDSVNQVIEANAEVSDRVISQVYEGASKIERLKYKLILERMRQLMNESFTSVLNEMAQIDKKHRKFYEHTTVCGLPREIWLKIFNLIPQQDYYWSFIRATCFSFNIIIRELKASSSPSQYQSQTVSEIMSQAAANGQLSYVKFLRNVGRKLTPDIMAKAASSGNIELVKFVREQGVTIDWVIVKDAARSGNLEVHSYTRNRVTEKDYDFDDDDYMVNCVLGGNIDIIKTALYENSVPLKKMGSNSRYIAHSRNGKAIMQLLVDYGAPIEKWKANTDWTWHATIYGDVEYLKYLVELGFEIRPSCAAEASTLECVQYLFERGFKDPDLIENAAKAGRADIVKFAYEVCHHPLTSKALIKSIEPQLYQPYDFPPDYFCHDQLYFCFEYLVHNNCPMNANEVWRAVGTHGDERHVKLLLAKKVEFDPVYFETALPTCRDNDINRALVMQMVQQGLPLPDDICDLAAKAGYLELLTYAHSLGKPFSRDTVVKASGSFKCLKYVIDHGADMSDASYAMLNAAASNDVPSLALLLEHNCPIPENIEMCLSEPGCLEANKYYYDFLKRAKK